MYTLKGFQIHIASRHECISRDIWARAARLILCVHSIYMYNIRGYFLNRTIEIFGCTEMHNTKDRYNRNWKKPFFYEKKKIYYTRWELCGFFLRVEQKKNLKTLQDYARICKACTDEFILYKWISLCSSKIFRFILTNIKKWKNYFCSIVLSFMYEFGFWKKCRVGDGK